MIHPFVKPLARRPGPSRMALFLALLSVVAIFQLAARASAAEEEQIIEISIKDHRFEPAEVKLPANRPVKISLKNLDPSVEEFESSELGFEKIVAGNSDVVVRLKPLQPGTYLFFGEYHIETALGHFVVE
jgi:hypothetical protein